MLDCFTCKYEMMSPSQTIFSPNGEAIKVNTDVFIKGLCSFVDMYENYDVRLIGNEEFLRGLAKQIKNYSFVNYHNKPTPQIQVNGGIV